MQDIAQEVVNTLQNKGLRFSIGSRPPPLSHFYTPFSQPPLDLEHSTLMTGIAAHYKMPEEMTARDVQNYAMLQVGGFSRRDELPAEVTDKFAALNALMTAHNPVLEKLKYNHDDGWRHYDVLLGIASDFKSEDIQFYLDGHTGATQKKPEYHQLHENISNKINLNWVPALSTLQKIDKQLPKMNTSEKLSIKVYQTSKPSMKA